MFNRHTCIPGVRTTGGRGGGEDGGITISNSGNSTALISSVTVSISTNAPYIVYTDGSAELVPVSDFPNTLPVNSKTFYSFTFYAPNFPVDPILIGRRVDGTSVNLDFDLAYPHALKLRDPIVGGTFNGYRPINTYAEFALINTNTVTLGYSYKQEADLDLLGNTTNTGGPQPAQQNWTPIGSRPGVNAPTFGIGNPASNANAAKFSGTAWPSIADNAEWCTGDGSGGGKYWKSLGSWNGGAGINPLTGAKTEFPKLY